MVLLFALLLSCSTYEPPGGGEPKGCTPVAEIQHGLVRGLGLSSHLEWEDDERSTARRAFETSTWSELGVGNIRRDILWRDLEPEQGVWNLGPVDRLFESLDDANAELMALMNYGNTWASPAHDDQFRPPDNLDDFGDYVATIASEYGHRIRWYEIWNEPNAGLAFWRPEEDPEAYGELLVTASARIREVDEDALIAFGGVFLPRLLLNTGGLDFVRQVHQSVPDLADHIDALAYHPYRYPFSPPEHQDDAQDSLVTTACAFRDLAEELGNASMPLWITELGWHTATDAIAAGTTHPDQASYLVRAALIAFSQGVEIFDWYTFRNSGSDLQDQEDMFGLYEWDEDPLDALEPTPKASAAAFASLSHALAGHDTVEDLSEWLGLDDSTWALQLTGGDGVTTALWTVEGTTTVLLPGRGKATLQDLSGDVTTVRARGGAFSLDLGPSPVFHHVEGEE